MSAIEHMLKDKNGRTFRLLQWKVENPKTLVLIHHGLGEHAGRMEIYGQQFNSKGVEVISYDAQGHGKEPGLQGVVLGGIDMLADDLEEVIATSLSLSKAQSITLLGHSMGGLVVTRYMTSRQPNPAITSLIVSAPALYVNRNMVIYAKLSAATVLRWVYPTMTLSTDILHSRISSDPEQVKEYSQDPLIHDRINPAMGVDCLTMGDYCIANANKVKIPTFIFHGQDDEICNIVGSRMFASNMDAELCTYKEYEKARHEVHHETKEIVDRLFTDLLQWHSELAMPC